MSEPAFHQTVEADGGEYVVKVNPGTRPVQPPPLPLVDLQAQVDEFTRAWCLQYLAPAVAAARSFIDAYERALPAPKDGE